MNAVDKNIRMTKKLNRNIFRRFNFGKSFWLNVIYAVIASSVLVGFVADLLQIDKNIATVIATLTVLTAKQMKDRSQFPEPFRANEYFVGLCSTPDVMEKTGQSAQKDSNLLTQNQDSGKDGFISRETEVDYLKGLINRAFESDKGKTGRKKGICLAGASGCGKTVLIKTLANQLKQQESPVYEVCYFDDIYSYNQEDVSSCKGKWNRKIAKGSEGKRILAIFDQFEKVLQLDSEGKSFVFRRISELAEKKNVMILFSIREEYLLLFLESFSMDSMEESKDEFIRTNVTLENLVKIANKDVEIKVSDSQNKAGWESGRNYGKEKENHNCKGTIGKLIKGKLFKENQIPIPHIIMLESRHNLLPNVIVGNEMIAKCKGMCGDNYEEGKRIYEVVKDRPLIEQQIILNMKSHEALPSNFEKAYDNREFATLMNDYYDVQLCSTEQYLTACQAMYVLSKARIDNIEVYRNILEDAVCIAGESERKDFQKCLSTLIDLQLIKSERTNSNEQKYEVTHDFVAKSFIEYAVMSLSPEIRCALDDAYTVSVSGGRKHKTGKARVMKCYETKINSDSWITVVWVACLIVVLMRFIIQRVVISYGSVSDYLESVIGQEIPMRNTVYWLDACISSWGTLTIPVMVMSVTSLFYIYNFYRNITQFYSISAGFKSSDKHTIFGRRYLTILLY